MTKFNIFPKQLVRFIVSSTKRNIFITLSDFQDNIILKKFSLGTCGFKNRHKGTTFAFMKIIYEASLYCLNKNYNYTILIIYGRLYLNRALLLKIILTTTFKQKSLKIFSIKDLTSYPFNGWRGKKQKQ
uniref:30S ribosomal protein S11 n=1 Tax=Nephromyces sp. ex Molgula occidentalis TaxID=2544991 RepID=A0A5C1H897_9APIC|nr:30S ribosomal protein S11 [Nephromyces sp. ex Molgula occidentalis]